MLDIPNSVWIYKPMVWVFFFFQHAGYTFVLYKNKSEKVKRGGEVT